MKRAGPTSRLFALLADSEAVEAQELAEIHADLAGFGIDPASTIAMTRRLAEEAHSPALGLLGRIAKSELSDEQTQAESSGPKVRSRHDKTVSTERPQDSQPKLHRRAKVVRPRRISRLVGYGLGALAASLAIVTLLDLSAPATCFWPHTLRYPWRECDPIQYSNRAALTAVLVVQPKLVPAALRNANLPQSDLLKRLRRADADAAGMEVVALFSVRHPNGVLSDGALLDLSVPIWRHGRSNTQGSVHVDDSRASARPPTLRAQLLAMERLYSYLSRNNGVEDPEVVMLLYDIEAARKRIDAIDNASAAPETLAALQDVTGPLPDNLIAIELPPRSH